MAENFYLNWGWATKRRILEIYTGDLWGFVLIIIPDY